MAKQFNEPKRPVKQFSAYLVEKRHEHGDTWTYYFKTDESFPYEAAAYVHVRIALENPKDAQVHEFSFASAPHDDLIALGIDSKSKSPYHQSLLELAVGDEVKIFKTNRHMMWPPEENDVVFVGGGIGITPFRSMFVDAKKNLPNVTMTVIHVAREYMYEDDFAAAGEMYHKLTRETLRPKLAEIIEQKKDARYYIVGSTAFIDDIRAFVESKGIEKIETDPFKGYKD